MCAIYCLTALLIGLLLLIGANSADVRLPPAITTHLEDVRILGNDETVELDCKAVGVPEPQYEWLKDGKALQIPGINGNIQIWEGLLRIKQTTIFDEGYYQCRAFNMYGAAMSKVVLMRKAFLTKVIRDDNTLVSERVVREGEPFTLACDVARSFPKLAITWAIGPKPTSDGGSQIGDAIALSRRIQVDDDGNLHFAYIMKDDAQTGKVYKCNQYNPAMDLLMGGSSQELRVIPVIRVEEFQPRIQYSSPSPLIALEGRNITIKCVFSGKPAPSVTWSRAHGKQLPSGRYEIRAFETEIKIINVEKSDEGSYTCKARNSRGTYTETIEVYVQAAPVFLSRGDGPHNQNVTEGTTVTVYCHAHADPAASIVWYRNGEEIDFNRYRKYRLEDKRRQLKILDVCKTCAESDLAVIQCNASNVHGYVYAEGYINVVEKTVITIKPENVELSVGNLNAHLRCAARADDSTPVSIDWYRVSLTDSTTTEHISNRTSKVYIDKDSTLFFHVNNFSEWIDLRGLYRCEARNEYSFDKADATLTPEDMPLPSPAPAMAGLGDLWWIFVIIAAILLLLILLICCCICTQRNKGDTYPVDEKERKSGNNPEKELEDGGFRDYQRPEGEPLKGSRASLNSSIKIESDEEGSLNEYGDIDAGKFTEDGSFIGDYGVDKKRANASDQKV